MSSVAQQFFSPWLELLSSPPGALLDDQHLLRSISRTMAVPPAAEQVVKRPKLEEDTGPSRPKSKYIFGGASQLIQVDRSAANVARDDGAKLLGQLISSIGMLPAIQEVLLASLKQRSVFRRTAVALIISELALSHSHAVCPLILLEYLIFTGVDCVC
jgi:hypothetical protein